MTSRKIDRALSDCARAMGVTEEKVVEDVLMSADGTIDYRTRLSEAGILDWLCSARNRAAQRKTRQPASKPLPWNFYSGEW